MLSFKTGKYSKSTQSFLMDRITHWLWRQLRLEEIPHSEAIVIAQMLCSPMKSQTGSRKDLRWLETVLPFYERDWIKPAPVDDIPKTKLSDGPPKFAGCCSVNEPRV